MYVPCEYIYIYISDVCVHVYMCEYMYIYIYIMCVCVCIHAIIQYIIKLYCTAYMIHSFQYISMNLITYVGIHMHIYVIWLYRQLHL